MSETTLVESSSPRPTDKHPQCYFCGRKDSGRWHYAATLGGLLCDECHRRVVHPSPVAPPGSPPP